MARGGLKFSIHCLHDPIVLQVYLQLANRYDKEIRGGRRSVLTKIQHRDEQASVHMVLCVAEAELAGDQVRLLLTDGWSEAHAKIDEELEKQVRRGRLCAGDKVRIYAAERADTGSAPGERLVLRLTANNTRPAEWHARLGRSRDAPFLVSIRSIISRVGVVPAVKVVVQRVMPLVYMETRSDGSKVWRSEAAEENAEADFAARVGVEWEDFVTRSLADAEKGEADSGSQGGDADAARRAERLREALRSEFMRQGGRERRTVPLLRFQVRCTRTGGVPGASCFVTWWRPGDVGHIREGAVLLIRNLQVAQLRYRGLLQLQVHPAPSHLVWCRQASQLAAWGAAGASSHVLRRTVSPAGDLRNAVVRLERADAPA